MTTTATTTATTRITSTNIQDVGNYIAALDAHAAAQMHQPEVDRLCLEISDLTPKLAKAQQRVAAKERAYGDERNALRASKQQAYNTYYELGNDYAARYCIGRVNVENLRSHEFFPPLAGSQRREQWDAFCAAADTIQSNMDISVDSTALDAAKREATPLLTAHDAAEAAYEKLTDQMSTAEAVLRSSAASLPEALANWPSADLRELANVDLSAAPVPDDYEHKTWAAMSAYARGEINLAEPCCANGYVTLRIAVAGHDLDVLLDDEVGHPRCQRSPELLESLAQLPLLLPPLFRETRAYRLQPWPTSPMPERTQRKLIESVKRGMFDENGYMPNGWLMVGPPGTSKSTYASAVILDWLTERRRHTGPSDDAQTCMEMEFSDGQGRVSRTADRLNYSRIKVPTWLREIEDWTSRDFHAEVDPPSITPEGIEAATSKTEFSPILWLEELDKFKPTETRLAHLYRLIDAVYEANGTIVATANEALPQLRVRLGDAIFRRITGRNDSPEGFEVWDMFAMVTAKKQPVGNVEKAEA